MCVLAFFMLRGRPVLAIVLVALCVAALLVVPAWIDTLDDPRLKSEGNAIGRLDTSALLWDLFLQKPLFGWGPLKVTTLDYGGWVSHNSFFTLLVATGLAGMVPYAVPISAAVARVVRWGAASGSVERTARVFALAAPIAYIVTPLAIDMQYLSYPPRLFRLSVALMLTPA